ncbi:MAG: B12-binding domain-containing protein [Methanomassiliicoccaceae archaeon]|nr:B12-binding domain-containing protein [Methanomassiliicoccaceae archaeon]MCL2145642.1 B12-binding domain-containing protein [Methanomassiliicoccaceae archaeon]
MVDNKKALHDAVIAYKVPGIQEAVENARKAGLSAGEIIDAMGEGMTEVGILFERGKLFLPHVLSAAQGMKSAMEVLGPELLQSGDASTRRASVVMGTVEGDVHDIGKSICSTMLQCAGFDVHDLGRDVAKSAFIKEIKGGCTMCGMSALMTTTMTVQRDVIDILKTEGIRDKVIVMVGGAPVTQAYADKIGADIYGETASETTGKAKAISK